MAAAIQVAGLATITVDTGSAHALETLGYTQNGASVRFNGFFLDVHTDENGGDDGPPTDVQYLGETADITLDFTKFDTTVADKIRPRIYGGSAGTVGSVGTLMSGSSSTYRLCINSPTTPLNFPVVIFREPIEINKGTKYSTWRLVGTAYKNGSNVLYNATVS